MKSSRLPARILAPRIQEILRLSKSVPKIVTHSTALHVRFKSNLPSTFSTEPVQLQRSP